MKWNYSYEDRCWKREDGKTITSDFLLNVDARKWSPKDCNVLTESDLDRLMSCIEMKESKNAYC